MAERLEKSAKLVEDWHLDAGAAEKVKAMVLRRYPELVEMESR